MKTLLLALSLLPALARADGRWIEIGPEEAVDCKNIENYTVVMCNPYRHEHVHDDPFSPAFALRQDLHPLEQGQCLHDAAGGIVFTCSVPAGWVDPRSPAPPAPPEDPVPQPRPQDPQHNYLVSAFNDTDRLLGTLANDLGGDKGPRVPLAATQHILTYAQEWNGLLRTLTFVAPPSCQAQCDALAQARETVNADVDAFRRTSPEQYDAKTLARLKGEAQAALDLVNTASPAPALVPQDVCGGLFFGDTGSGFFHSGTFGLRSTITIATRTDASLRVEYLDSSGRTTSQADGTCRQTAPDLWEIRAPMNGQQLVISLQQVNPESKALAVRATVDGRNIQIRR